MTSDRSTQRDAQRLAKGDSPATRLRAVEETETLWQHARVIRIIGCAFTFGRAESLSELEPVGI
jgi:uncharacterized protein YcsI (UPF0317 family)